MKSDNILGVTIYKAQEILLLESQANIIKTLKHELMHVWLYEYGHNQEEKQFNCEDICEIIASSNDFINEVVEQYLNIEITNIYANDKLVETIKKVGDLNARDRGYMDYNNPKDRNKK